MLKFDQNFMDKLENQKEECDIVVFFLSKVGIPYPYDDDWDNSFEFIQRRVAEQVGDQSSFDLKAVEANINNSFQKVLDVVTKSDYIEFLGMSGVFKLQSIKESLEVTKKGLLALYYDEYEKFIRREAAKKIAKEKEECYRNLLKELHEIK